MVANHGIRMSSTSVAAGNRCVSWVPHGSSNDVTAPARTTQPPQGPLCDHTCFLSKLHEGLGVMICVSSDTLGLDWLCTNW